MIRLAISVEGPTEEGFVKNVIENHLLERDVEPVPISLDGNITVERLASDMAKLTWNFDCVTSLVDFYGFRDKNTATREELEHRIQQAVDDKVNRSWDQSRLIPYVQQYEFEGLLFSDVGAFARIPDVPEDCVEELRRIRSMFATPEDINDSKHTAPSKRIKRLIPRYDKVVYGSLIAMETGLETVRMECSRFNSWMTRLESLAASHQTNKTR